MQTKTLPNWAGSRSRFDILLVTTIGSIALAVLAGWWIVRLHLGVDFSDESWYMATIYRFLLGDKPYVDEIFLMQGFALIPYPFFRLFQFQQSTEGIVLFGRYLYAIFNLIVGISLAHSARAFLSRPARITLILAWVSFLPYGLPNLSYNTLGLGFVSLAFCAFLERSVYGGALYWWGVYGLAMGAALLAHPSMLLVCVIGNAVVLVFEKQRRMIAWGLYVAGGLCVGLVALLCYSVSLSSLVENYRLTVVMNTAFNNRPRMEKVLKVLVEGWRSGPFVLGLGLLFLQRARFQKFRQRLAFTCLLVLPVLTFFMTRARTGGMGPHGFNLYFGLLAPFFYGFIENRAQARRLLIGGWLPTATAAFATSVTSYNGLTSSGVPSALCCVISFLLLSEWWKQSFPKLEGTGHFFSSRLFRSFGAYASLIPIAAYLVSHSYMNVRNIYHEDAIGRLTEKIESGPFRGLYTSGIKKVFIDEYSRKLEPYRESPGRILFYPTFPAGYLMTSRLPLLPTTWGCMGIPDSVCGDYVFSHQGPADVWVRVNQFYYFSQQIKIHEEPHFLDPWLKEPVELQQSMQVFSNVELQRDAR